MTYLLKPALFALAAATLSACNSPSPRFMDGSQKTVEAGGMTFGVWRVGDEVEVIRTSSHVMPRLGEILSNAEKAIVMVTGCPVKQGTLIGDQSVINAVVDCPAQASS